MVLISFSENKCIIFLFCSSVNEFIFRLIENRLMNASSRISNRFVAASTMILFGNLSNSCINVIVILLISPSVPPPFPFFLLQLIFYTYKFQYPQQNHSFSFNWNAFFLIIHTPEQYLHLPMLYSFHKHNNPL